MKKGRKATRVEARAVPVDGATRPDWVAYLARGLEHPAGAALVYFLLLLAVLGPVIFSSPPRVLSLAGADLWGQYMSWRQFGFSELKAGNLAMWNPHIYCGMPYFSGFQSALLYPPNWLHLVLPIPLAINAGILFHLWAGGMSAWIWLRWGRQLHAQAALLGGALFMFCGPHYLHVAAGHLSNLCVMAWVPLVFWVIDRWNGGGGIRVLLVGAGVIALQILAGHPQYVFFTAVMAGIYNVLLSPWSFRGKGRALAGQMAFYVGGALLSAVQLLPGLLGNAEGARAGGLTFDQARIFSFPLENLVTLVSPSFWGSLDAPTYAGRWLYWEMVLFVTVTALFLALLSFQEKGRRLGPALLFLITALIFSLGAYTPLYALLHAHVPGFNLFRGQSKFILFVALALIWLAAEGQNALLRGTALRWSRSWMGVSGILLGVFTIPVWVFQGPHGVAEMTHWLQGIRGTHEVLYHSFPGQEEMSVRAMEAFRGGLWVTALWSACLAGAWFLRKRAQILATLLMVMAVGEALLFAVRHTKSFSMAEFDASFPEQYFRDKPGDYRIFFEMGNNIPMFHGRDDMWGNDPALPKRYAAYIAQTQGYTAESAGQTIVFREIDASYPMLGLKYVCSLNRQTFKLEVSELGHVLPRASLFKEYQVVENAGSALAKVASDKWDYQKQVVLEESPEFVLGTGVPVTGEKVEMERMDSDTIRLKVDCPGDRILLITENYSTGWTARSADNKLNYPVLPANSIFQGIPLAAGHHEIVLEYVQRGFLAGCVISLLSLASAVIVAWKTRGPMGRNAA